VVAYAPELRRRGGVSLRDVLTVISTPSSARMRAAYDEASSAVDIVMDCGVVTT
jgi:hypothetical protein